MAAPEGKEVLRNVKIEVAGVNLSDHTSSVSLESTADEVDFTGFSASAFREYGQGLKEATITATMFNDYKLGSVVDTIGSMYDNNVAGTVKIWPDAAGSVVWTMVSKVYSKPMLAGAIGDASTLDVTFKNAGTAGITRGTI